MAGSGQEQKVELLQLQDCGAEDATRYSSSKSYNICDYMYHSNHHLDK